MKDMLSPLGFEIIEAIDGRDALDKTKTCSPDLIVMDLMMPVLDGIEAAGRIRQIPALNDVIIIGMSANVFPRTQQKSITAGCNGFIVKPVDLENLLECLHVHLKLEWIYEDKPVTQEMAVYSKRQPLILPPKEELLVLYGLAKSGDIAGLRRQISRVAELDPKFGPFIAKLTQLAKEFRINEIKRYLEAYVSGNYTEGSK